MPNPPYKKDEYIHFLYNKTGESKKVKAKEDSERDRPAHNLIEIPFHQIESMNLDNRGETVPFSSKNVINVERYLLWYWGRIMGADACWLFIHLQEYCDDTDICYPKIAELADKLGRSKPTILKLLRILEDNNFIIVIHRLNKLANNKETSPIYKLRQTIPLLSIEQYRTLPTVLRKSHDKYMDKYVKGTEQELSKYDSKNTWNELAGSGEKILSKSARKKIQDIIDNAQDTAYLLKKLGKGGFIENFHNELIDTFSKPVFDTFFPDSIGVFVDYEKYSAIHIIVKTDSNKEILIAHQHIYKDKLPTMCENRYEKKISDITFYTVKDYILKLERGS